MLSQTIMFWAQTNLENTWHLLDINAQVNTCGTVSSRYRLSV